MENKQPSTRCFSHHRFPPPVVIMKHGIAVENRIQQWLWGNNNKEHRAAWPLPLLAANQSLAPISEHVPRAKLTPHTEQERRGEERGDLVQPHDGSENQLPSLPTTHSSPTSTSQRAFPYTSTLILSHPFLSFFIVLEIKKKSLFLLLSIEGRSADYPMWFG